MVNYELCNGVLKKEQTKEDHSQQAKKTNKKEAIDINTHINAHDKQRKPQQVGFYSQAKDCFQVNLTIPHTH